MFFGKHVSADFICLQIHVFNPLPSMSDIKNQNPNRMKKNVFINLVIVYLMTLSVVQTIQCQMIG
jgi:hypothetical protein